MPEQSFDEHIADLVRAAVQSSPMPLATLSSQGVPQYKELAKASGEQHPKSVQAWLESHAAINAGVLYEREIQIVSLMDQAPPDQPVLRPFDLLNICEKNARAFRSSDLRALQNDFEYCHMTGLLEISLMPCDPAFERLEYLGDRVLSLELSKKQLAASTYASPGTMTEERISMERREALAVTFDEVGLAKYIKPSCQTNKSFGAKKWKLKCDVVEAVLGECQQRLDHFYSMPDATKNIEAQHGVRRTLDGFVDVLMYFGKKLKEPDEISQLHDEARRAGTQYV